MNHLNLALMLMFCSAAGLASACELSSAQSMGKVIETWETTNKNFKIRVTAYDEKGAYPAPGGGYYVFQSSPMGVDSWKEIMTFRHDDPVAIPRDQVRFVNEQVGYVFMGWLYAVTTNGGRSWSVWDASKDAAFLKTYKYDLIREISVLPDGAGRMVLKLTDDTTAELKTEDYGQHWTAN